MGEVIGFVGLGIMGLPMARNLAKGSTVCGYDLREERRRLAEGGIESVSSLEEICRRCGTVFLSLPSSAAVREVCVGERGILAVPLLNRMGSSVVRVGDVGAGEVAKLVNNLIVGITFAAVAEGFSLGTQSGIDPAELYKAIRGGWAGSRVLEVAAPAMLERDFAPGGTVDIHWKDLGYALSLAKETDVSTPMTARAAGLGGESQPAVVKLWESLGRSAERSGRQ